MSSETTIRDNGEVSFKELIIGSQKVFYNLKKQWWKFFILGIIGANWFFYSYSKPVYYKTQLSFVVEEGKFASGGWDPIAGQFVFAAIASLFFDIIR